MLLVALILIIVASVIGFLTLRKGSSASPSPIVEQETAENWHVVDTNFFTVSLPSEWKFNPMQGIDSYVGEFVGDGVTLGFDYGWYSNPLADEGDSHYTVTYETIDDRHAKIVVPATVGIGVVGVYFADIDGNQMNRLQISGEYLTGAQQETALKIFRTLQFTDKEDKPVPSTSFDFIFKYGVGAKNILDTFNDTYTKDMITDDPITISLKLTDEELDGIRQKIEELNLFQAKEESQIKMLMNPCTDYDLIVQTFAVQRRASSDGCTQGIDQQFAAFETYIRSILETKTEYRALPEPQGGYM